MKSKITFLFTCAICMCLDIYPQMTQSFCADGNSSFSNSLKSRISSSSISFSVSDICLTTDGGAILAGSYIQDPLTSNSLKGFYAKINQNGRIVWSRSNTIQLTDPSNELYYYKAIELENQAVLLSGYAYNNITGNHDLLLTKINSATGDVLWTGTYKSPLWTTGHGSADFFLIHSVHEDFSSDAIYVTGLFSDEQKACLIKFNKFGNLIWSKLFDVPGYTDNPIGVVVENNEIKFFTAPLRSAEDGSYTSLVSVYSINNGSGGIRDQHFYRIANNSDPKKVFNTQDFSVQKDINGNYLIAGNCIDSLLQNWPGSGPYYQAAVLKLKPDMEVSNAFAFKTNNAYIQPRLRIDKNANGILSLYSFPDYTENLVIDFSENNIVQQRLINLSEPAAAMQDVLVKESCRNFRTRFAISTETEYAIEVLKNYSADTSLCSGSSVDLVSVENFSYEPVPPPAYAITTNIFVSAGVKPLTTTSLTLNEEIICEQVINAGKGNSNLNQSLFSRNNNKSQSAENYSGSPVIFPNPFYDRITINLVAAKPTAMKVTLMSTDGKNIFTQIRYIVAGKNILNFDNLNNVPAGIYILSAKGDGINYDYKVIKH